MVSPIKRHWIRLQLRTKSPRDMWSKIYIICSLLTSTLAQFPLAITRSLSDGVKSAGYKVIYGDEDLTVLNEIANEYEKENVLKKDPDLAEALPPLPPEDVKCMMSVDRHCSKDMGEMKAVIIQAIRDDCKKCTNNQKEKAGKIIASLMAHDPNAWKLFLTRYGGLDKVQKLIG
nr:uncharacterized protein LOC128677927 [Plodia interpunctella]